MGDVTGAQGADRGGVDEHGADRSRVDRSGVPPEWHDRLAGRAAAWAQAHPVALRRLLVARAVLLWVGVLVLVVMLLRWPDAWPAVRAWLVTLAVVAVFFVLVRSRTVGWGLVAGTFGFALLWAPVVAAVSLALAASTGLQTRDAGPSIAIAGLVEESFKLLPLLVLAALVPGWFRRRSAGDVLVLGYALGAGFNAFEDFARRLSSGVANSSLLGDLLLQLLGVGEAYTLNPLAPNAYTDVRGLAGSPGHMVWTAFAAGVVALAWALWRSAADREGAGASARRLGAVGLGCLGLAWPVTEHAAFNATVGDGLAWLGAWQVPWLGQLGWLVTGRGLGTGVWLGLVLVAVLLVDAHRRHVAFLGRDDAAVDGMWSPRAAAARVEPRIEAAFAPATDPRTAAVLRVPSTGLRAVVLTAVRAATQAWHDVVVVLAGHSLDAPDGPSAPTDAGPSSPTGLTARRAALRRGKLSVALVRARRAEAMTLTTPGTEPDARRRLRVVAGAAAAALAVSSLLVAWLGAVAIGPDIGGAWLLGAGPPSTAGDGVWLAGLFDDLDDWWSGLSLVEQVLVGAGIAALIALSGGSLGLAFGLSGVATYGLSKAGGLADLTRDPRGATRDYLTTATWQDLVVDLAEFGLTFAPGSFAGAATGRAVRQGVTEYAADPAAFRARRAGLLRGSGDDADRGSAPAGMFDSGGWTAARIDAWEAARRAPEVQGRVLATGADAAYQVRVAGPYEVLLESSDGGTRIWADHITRSADGVVALEAKNVRHPGGVSLYEGAVDPRMLDIMLKDFDDEMRRYATVVLDGGNPVNLLRVHTPTEAAARFLELRVRRLVGPDVPVDVVVTP